MPNAFSDTTFSSTYKDDYRDSDNYHRILFNSARALQARELTQMQTIIQEEMYRFGSNIFKEGAVVQPGGLSENFAYEFVKLQGIPTLYPGNTLTGGGITARVIEFVAKTATDPATAYIEYTDVSGVSGGATITRFPGATALTAATGTANSNPSITSVTTVQATAGVTVSGQGCKVSVNKGSYFVRGHFVQTLPQSIIVSKYTNTPTFDLGFVVAEDIVTAADTDALFDNQNVEPNRTAPGADRYRITLTLASSLDLANTDNFIIINRYIDGVRQEEIDESDYNQIEKRLALRTKEESGDYVVGKFTSTFSENADDTKLTLSVGPAISYVDGFRYSQPQPQKLTINKSRATETINSEAIGANYGHFLQLDTIKGLPETDVLEQWSLWDSVNGADGTGSPLGTARIRQVAQSGGFYRFHIFDVVMTGSNNFRDVKSIGHASNANEYGNLVLENGVAVIKEIDNNNAFFDLPRERPKSLSVTSLTEERHQSTSTGTTTLALGTVTDGAYSDGDLWIVTDSVGAPVTGFTLGTTNNELNGEIIGLPGSGNYSVLYYVNKEANGTPRTKTLQQDFVDTGSLTNNELVLTHADIYEFKEILDADSNDVTNRFDLDNGQRDNFYDRGKVALRSGTIAGNIRVKYDYFEHGTTGSYFSVNSYTNEIPYQNIPTHRQNNGIEIELRNVLDFRSVKDASGNFIANLINEMPRNTDTVQANVTYYQSRRDILVTTPTGLKYIEGQPSVTPAKPIVPNGTMELYNYELNPYTDDEGDLTTNYIDNRRYTMRDIGSIVDRIDNIEEAVTLNLLELETSTIEVFDSNGNNRFKNGFFADNFTDLVFSDIFNEQYFASLDLEDNTIRPFNISNNAPLPYDSDLSAGNGTTVRGGVVYLNYTEVDAIVQDLATETENINPFDIVLYNGTLELSPDVDLWREEVTINGITPPRLRRPVVFRSAKERRRAARNRSRGRRAENQANARRIAEAVVLPTPIRSAFGLTVGQVQNFEQPRRQVLGRSVDRRQINNRTNRTTITTTIATILGRRLVGIDLLPFVRSRKVFFRARDLAPNREHFFFFEDFNMEKYVFEETYKDVFAQVADDRFIGGANLNKHPSLAVGATTTLVTNAQGVIEGSFYIPNNDDAVFDAGTKQVRIADTTSSDINASLSSASTNYEAQGTRFTWQTIGTTTTTSQTRDRTRRRDPVAQSFQFSNPNGGYITSVEVFFATKSNTVPITLELRPVENGVPSQTNIVPGSTVQLDPTVDTINKFDANDVANAGANAMAQIRQNGTVFTFDRPIFLPGQVEFAFILMANTQDYNIYVSRVPDFLVGSQTNRVTKQPSLGSFFMSQTTVTWTPDQWRDAMFTIKRADFVTSGNFVLSNDSATVPTLELMEDPLLTDSGDSDVTLSLMGHGFMVNDEVTISGFDSTTTYGGILGSSINGTRTINKVDGFGFQFKADSAATATLQTGGAGIISERNFVVNEAIPILDTFVPQVTTADFSTTIPTGRSLTQANNETIATYGTPTGRDIQPYERIRFDDPRVIVNGSIETAETALTNGSSTRITGAFTTTDTWVSPLLDLTTAGMNTIMNLVDNQDSALGADNSVTNNPIRFVAETDPFDASTMSKHITIPITLEEAAVGLKVLAAVNRPDGANVDLYYRTTTEGTEQVIDEQDWTYQAPERLIGADENRDIFREYEWLVGGINGTETEFSTFQLKLVFRSQNSSKIARVRDLRAIALGT